MVIWPKLKCLGVQRNGWKISNVKLERNNHRKMKMTSFRGQNDANYSSNSVPIGTNFTFRSFTLSKVKSEMGQGSSVCSHFCQVVPNLGIFWTDFQSRSKKTIFIFPFCTSKIKVNRFKKTFSSFRNKLSGCYLVQAFAANENRMMKSWTFKKFLCLWKEQNGI